MFERLIKPLSDEALRVKIIAKGARIRVDIQEAKKGEMLLSSAAFLLNKPI